MFYGVVLWDFGLDVHILFESTSTEVKVHGAITYHHARSTRSNIDHDLQLTSGYPEGNSDKEISNLPGTAEKCQHLKETDCISVGLHTERRRSIYLTQWCHEGKSNSFIKHCKYVGRPKISIYQVYFVLTNEWKQHWTYLCTFVYNVMRLDRDIFFCEIEGQHFHEENTIS